MFVNETTRTLRKERILTTECDNEWPGHKKEVMSTEVGTSCLGTWAE